MASIGCVNEKIIKITQLNGDVQKLHVATLSDTLEKIKSPVLQTEVEDLRLLIPTLTYRNKISNKKIPKLIFAGTFKRVDGELQLKEYSGLVLMNVTELSDLTEAAKVRETAARMGQTLAAFIGSSGRSVKILTRFSLSDGSLPQTEQEATMFHSEACYRAVTCYEMQLQRSIASRGCRLDFACRCSFDPDLYFNPNAYVTTIEQPTSMPQLNNWEQKQQENPDPIMRMIPGMERSKLISVLFETALQHTHSMPGLPPLDQDAKPFIIELARNCCRSGIPEEETVRWTSYAVPSEIPESEIRLTVVNTYKTERNFGNKPNCSKSMRLLIDMEEFLNRRYDLRFNTFRNENEYSDRKSFHQSFSPLDNRVMNSMVQDAHMENIEIWDVDIKRYLASNRVPDYNPIDHFLRNLPKWDGTDHIGTLARTLPNDNPVWEQLFYRWFLGMVRNWMEYDIKHANSLVPMLVGRQGDGKTNWCRNLLPPELQPYYAESMDLSNRTRAELMLTQYVLINFDEFDSISTSQQAFLKHLISKSAVNTRSPYKQTTQLLRRYVSFIATGNQREVLNDPSGTRRFLCVELTGSAPHELDINYRQLYAQALEALRKGERYWVDENEQHLSEEQNQPFTHKSLEEQLFLKYFRSATDHEPGVWMLAIEIIEEIETRSKRKLGNKKATHFGRILAKLNVSNRRTSDNCLYKVVRVER